MGERDWVSGVPRVVRFETHTAEVWIDAAVAEALAELDAARAALATETANANAYAHERDEALYMLRGTVRTLTTTRSLLGADASETVIEAAQRIAEALPRWVPVGERLPEVGRRVLVTFHGWPVVAREDGGVIFAVGTASLCPTYCPIAEGAIARREWRDGDYTVSNVLAWQPLPAPWVAP